MADKAKKKSYDNEYSLSANQMIEARRQEMEEYILPGFVSPLTLPSGETVNVFSRDINAVVNFGKG